MSDLSVRFDEEQALQGVSQGNVEVRLELVAPSAGSAAAPCVRASVHQHLGNHGPWQIANADSPGPRPDLQTRRS